MFWTLIFGIQKMDGESIEFEENARQLRLAVLTKIPKKIRHFPKTIAMGEITHLFRTNSFTRLFPARQEKRKRTTLNSVNRKVQSEIKKTAAAKNCR